MCSKYTSVICAAVSKFLQHHYVSSLDCLWTCNTAIWLGLGCNYSTNAIIFLSSLKQTEMALASYLIFICYRYLFSHVTLPKKASRSNFPYFLKCRRVLLNIGSYFLIFTKYLWMNNDFTFIYFPVQKTLPPENWNIPDIIMSGSFGSCVRGSACFIVMHISDGECETPCECPI